MYGAVKSQPIVIERSTPDHLKHLDSVLMQLKIATGTVDEPARKINRNLPADNKVLSPEEALSELRAMGAL